MIGKLVLKANLGHRRNLNGLGPFGMQTFVALGASITNAAFQGSSARDFVANYAKEKYGTTITVDEHATAGWTVQDLDDNIATILSNYTGQSDVVFAIHIGGNNISYTETWDERTQVQQDAMVDPYQDVIDAIEADGHKAVPFKLTYRITNSSPDDDPDADPKVNELDGSYTYNEDGLVPNVFDVNFSDYFNSDGEYNFDHYKYIRTMYEAMFDAASDTVHHNDMGEMIFAFYHFYPVLVASQSGAYMPTTVERDFSETVADPDTDVDVIFAPYTTGGGRGVDANINWIDMGSVNITDAGYIGTDIVQTDGTDAPNGMAFLYSGANKSFATTEETPANTSASLLNTSLRSSWAYQNASVAKSHALIEGLEPLRKYTVEIVARSDADGDQRWTANTDTVSSADAGNDNICTIETNSDPWGRIFILGTEVTSGDGQAGFSGCRVYSGWTSDDDPLFEGMVISFGGGTDDGSNVNFESGDDLAAGAGVNKLGVTVSGVAFTGEWFDGTNNGVSNPEDSTANITNDNALAKTVYRSGTSTTGVISGLVVGATYTVKIAASRSGNGNTQTFTVQGTAGTALDLDANPTEIDTFTGVVADSSGEISVSCSRTTGSSAYVYLNALEITRTA